jgi:hypothetical protein
MPPASGRGILKRLSAGRAAPGFEKGAPLVIRLSSTRLLLVLVVLAIVFAALNGGWAWDEFGAPLL